MKTKKQDMAGWEEVLKDSWVEVPASKSDVNSQSVNGKWYSPKFGCDSLEMTISDILSQERKRWIKETLRWAEKEVGKKCAKDDFIYKYLDDIISKLEVKK